MTYMMSFVHHRNMHIDYWAVVVAVHHLMNNGNQHQKLLNQLAKEVKEMLLWLNWPIGFVLIVMNKYYHHHLSHFVHFDFVEEYFVITSSSGLGCGYGIALVDSGFSFDYGVNCDCDYCDDDDCDLGYGDCDLVVAHNRQLLKETRIN